MSKQEQAHGIFSVAMISSIVPPNTNKNELAAAAVYLACRVQGFPRLLQEISEAATGEIDIPRTTIHKLQAQLVMALNLKVPIFLPSSLLPRINVKLSESYKLPARLLHTCCIFSDKLHSIDAMDLSVASNVIAGISVILTALVNRHPINVIELAVACYCTVGQLKTAYNKIATSFENEQVWDSLIAGLGSKPGGACELPRFLTDVAVQEMAVFEKSLPVTSSKNLKHIVTRKRKATTLLTASDCLALAELYDKKRRNVP
jgi:hypothetical protein